MSHEYIRSLHKSGNEMVWGSYIYNGTLYIPAKLKLSTYFVTTITNLKRVNLTSLQLSKWCSESMKVLHLCYHFKYKSKSEFGHIEHSIVLQVPKKQNEQKYSTFFCYFKYQKSEVNKNSPPFSSFEVQEESKVSWLEGTLTTVVQSVNNTHPYVGCPDIFSAKANELEQMQQRNESNKYSTHQVWACSDIVKGSRACYMECILS